MYKIPCINVFLYGPQYILLGITIKDAQGVSKSRNRKRRANVHFRKASAFVITVYTSFILGILTRCSCHRKSFIKSSARNDEKLLSTYFAMELSVRNKRNN